MTTMASARKELPNPDELRAQIEAMLIPQWVNVAAVAFAIPVPADQLIEWLAGNPIKTNIARFEKGIAAYLESRAAWLAEVKSADVHRLRELRFAKAREIRELSEKLVEEPSRTPYADMLHDSVVFGLHDLNSLFEEGETENCWRCGAAHNPPPAEVDTQIEINERGAAWSAWAPEEFRERLRAAMRSGDRVVAISGGGVWIRRPDGSMIRALKSGGIEAV
jgi:hypothetical protein